MARLLLAHRWCLSPLLVILVAACGCQTTRYDSFGAFVLGERATLSQMEAAPNAAATVSPSVVADTAGLAESVSSSSGRAGEPAKKPRHLRLVSYRERAQGDRSAESRRSPAPGNHLAAGGGSSLSLSVAALQDAQTADGDKAASTHPQDVPVHKGHSLAEINNKLNNPGADLAQLQFKLNWNQYQGNLGGNKRTRGRRSGQEGPSSQNSLTLDFQPVLPFKLDNGASIILRPTIPLTWKPHYNARSNGFDEQFGLGDAQLVGFYSRTDMKKGVMWGAGVTTQFPTHTDDVLGNDAFMIGPAGFYGHLGKWGSVGLFPQHWWNVGGGDGYTSLTALQAWYWFNVGKGWQIGGSPVMTYNWANDDSDNNLTVPVNLGVARTIMVGKLPVKIKFEGIYYAVTPDSFGPQWGLQLTITPVIPNPFEKHASN